jgi:hypothetical protein
MIVPVSGFAAIGSGRPLAEYFLSSMHNDGIGTIQSFVIAAFLLRESEQFGAGSAWEEIFAGWSLGGEDTRWGQMPYSNCKAEFLRWCFQFEITGVRI